MKTVSATLTDTEYKALEEYAKRCGTSRNKAIKRLLLGADFFDYILNYFQLDLLERATEAVKPAMYQKLAEIAHERAAQSAGRSYPTGEHGAAPVDGEII